MAVDTPRRPTLTLGPILYLWEPDAWLDFYCRIADEADVDTVVVGEVVCSKRQHFHEKLIGKALERLVAGGKTVRLASLGLITLEREMQASHALAQQDLEVEVSELSAHAAMAGKPHAVGPLVNVYNAATANVLVRGGATSICLPPELPATSIRDITPRVPAATFEVFAFGRVPLAISARCAHARVKGRVKDNCQFVCGDDPDGLVVSTLDGRQFLALNGVQTVSSTVQCYAGDLPLLLDCGVSAFRLSPQVCDMVAVARTFRSALDRRVDGREALARLGEIYRGAEFSNGFLHARPGHVLHMD